MNIQWYPGHMTKTKRMMQENISLVDIVIEILDARIPISSKNPDIDTLAKYKKRIVVLNKADIANRDITDKWKEFYEEKDFAVVITDSTKGTNFNQIWNTANILMKEKIERQKARGRIFVPIRAMIVGVPNVGKSTLINKYVKRSVAKTGDRPGVTRSKQWVKVKKGFELLDTPGILWPKFEDETVALNLAFTGAIKDEILDVYTLGSKLAEKLKSLNPEYINNRYNIKVEDSEDGHEILNQIGEARGFKQKGNVIDVEKASVIFLDEFRGGKLGNISLETPEDL